jgi:hypothetical protein
VFRNPLISGEDLEPLPGARPNREAEAG